MGRIGASLNGIERTLLNRLAEANAAANLNALRLVTLRRINAPRDDPHAFVSLSQLETQRSLVASTLSNVTAASVRVSEAQLAIDQIRTQLETIRAMALEDQDQALTASQRAANQAAIDAAIEQIGLLATTESGGRRLLDGSADFFVDGLNAEQIEALEVYARGAAPAPTIAGAVSTAATQGSVTYTGASSQTTSAATFTLIGIRGSSVITVANAEPLAEVATRVNLDSHLTGVTASVAGDVLTFTSIDYGSRSGVAIVVDSGTFNTSAPEAAGTDAVATINGQLLTGNGNHFAISDNGLVLDVEFVAGFTGYFDTIEISGDALTFALSTDLTQTSTLAIPSLLPARLGGPSGALAELALGGAKSGLGTNAPTAVRIVDEVLDFLTRVEGAVDGFATATIDASSELLDAFQAKLTDAIDAIDLVDEEEEALRLAKNQALASNALAALAILDQQRQGILALVQRIAGLN